MNAETGALWCSRFRITCPHPVSQINSANSSFLERGWLAPVCVHPSSAKKLHLPVAPKLPYQPPDAPHKIGANPYPSSERLLQLQWRSPRRYISRFQQLPTSQRVRLCLRVTL